jgi:hypothetical protein
LQLQSFFYLEFVWVGAPSLLSSGACHTLAAVGSLPVSKHTGGGGATPAFSSHVNSVFTVSCGRAFPPISSGAFHTTATVIGLPLSMVAGQVPLPMGSAPSPLSCGVAVTSFPLSKVAVWVPRLLTSLAGLFIYSLCGKCPSPTVQSSGHPALFAMCLFFFSCLFIIQLGFFSFFSLGGGQSVQGAMLICPRVVCGSTTCCSVLLLCSSKQVKSWCLVAWEPSWFLRLTWCGDAMCGLGVWKCQSFASSSWFFLQGVSPAFLQDFTLGSTCSASSL